MDLIRTERAAAVRLNCSEQTMYYWLHRPRPGIKEQQKNHRRLASRYFLLAAGRQQWLLLATVCAYYAQTRQQQEVRWWYRTDSRNEGSTNFPKVDKKWLAGWVVSPAARLILCTVARAQRIPGSHHSMQSIDRSIDPRAVGAAPVSDPPRPKEEEAGLHGRIIKNPKRVRREEEAAGPNYRCFSFAACLGFLDWILGFLGTTMMLPRSPATRRAPSSCRWSACRPLPFPHGDARRNDCKIRLVGGDNSSFQEVEAGLNIYFYY